MPVQWNRPLLAFLCVFVVYQVAEGLQTLWAPASPAGPALMLLAALLPWPLGRWLGGRGYEVYGLRVTASVWPLVAGGLLLAGLAKFASLAAGLALGVHATSALHVTVTPAAIAAAALTTFVPSIAEDILTRGFLLRVFPVRLGFWGFTVSSALLYTLNHLWRFDWGATEQLRLFCLGLAYGAAAWRSDSLWGAVALHWGWNLSNALGGLLVPLEVQSQSGARLLSAAVHLVLLGVVLAWLQPRRSSGGGSRGGSPPAAAAAHTGITSS